jgi:hypothetical protein
MFNPMGYAEVIFWLMLSFFAGYAMSPKRKTTWRELQKPRGSRQERSASESDQP